MIPLSILTEATLKNFIRVLRDNDVSIKHYPKLINTGLLALWSRSFHWVDHIYFKKKLESYVFKKSPLFIIGFWRSGGSYLYNLLSKDPANGYVSAYHAAFPNNLKTKSLFKHFINFMHPEQGEGARTYFGPDEPTEDEFALSKLTNFSLYHFIYFPEEFEDFYRNGIRFSEMSDTDRNDWLLLYRNLVIKSLYNTNGQRAIIKSPVNTARIRLIRDIFPDAHFIFLVRNPVTVYLSMKKFLVALLPATSYKKLCNTRISGIILSLYQDLVKQYLKDKNEIDPDHLIELRFEDLIADPVLNLKMIYSKFGYFKFDKNLSEFDNYIKSQLYPRKNIYGIFESELEKVLDKIGFAMKHWGYKLPEDLEITKDKLKSFSEF